MPVTEYATIPLIPGAAIEDASSSAGEVWRATLNTISSQPGYQRVYYGRQIENNGMVHLLIDWDSIADHESFTKDAAYQPFVKHLLTIVDGRILMQHASFAPHPPADAASNTRSPVTEVITAYFEERNDSYHENFKQFGDFAVRNAHGCTAAAGGWIVEDVQHSKLDKPGRGFLGLIGWESVEHHRLFRETQGFKDNIHLLKNEKIKVMEVHHACLTEK